MSNDDTLPLDLTDQDDKPFDVELIIRPTPDKLSQLENDMGFITDEQVQEEIQAESVIINARIDDEVNTLNSAIESEAATRAETDTSLQNDINTLNDDLTLEISNRTSADEVLQGNIDTVSGNLTTEISDRQDADATLQGNINTVAGDLSLEETARINADTTLQGNIDTLSGTVTSNYNTLDGKITDEATARGNADTTLQNNIDTLSGTVTSNYNTLDGKIGDNKTAIDNHKADKNNPHEVTKSQVGLGNVDNTSDADKPVSTAQQTALDGKVDKLVTKPTAGTYTKVTVNGEGQVTSGTTLSESDIPNLHLTKVTDVTSTATEVNQLHESGAIKSDFEKLHAITATASELNTLEGITASTSELNILDGATLTTAELNTLDGITATTTELNYVDGVTSSIQTQLDSKVDENAAITGATKCKITYDSKGLVTGGDDLQQSDIPALNLSKISDVTASASEVNILDGATVSTAELNVLDGITASTTELNYTDGVTSNIQTQLNGKQPNITGGATTITSNNLTTARALVSDGNGKVAVSDITTTELGYLDGATSNIQAQIGDITDLIPAAASTSNELADKNFVNSTVATNTANFIGTFNSVADLEAYSGTLTNNDYAYVIVTDSVGNTAYDRYKYTTATTPASWVFEFKLNNSSFTADQWAAINSLITAATKVTHTANTQVGSGTTPVYVGSDGAVVPISYTIEKSVPSSAKFTDTTYEITTGSTNGTISVAVDGGTASDVAVKGLGSAAYTPSTDYATSSQGAKADTAIQSVTTGSTNGTIDVDGSDVAVYGLGSAAYTNSSAYATATQGGKADTAVQSITTGSTNGTISVDGTDVSVYGLGSAAYTASTAYATSTQGGKADSAIQTVKVNGTALTPDSNNAVNVVVPDAQVQSNWTETNTSSKAYIQNKPSLSTVATSGSYNDLSDKPTIPTVNNATLTIQKNSTTVKTFTANASTDVTCNITVPTKTSDITNDSGYITGISSSDVTTALGYTPYNSSNPSGYQANVIETVKVNGTAQTVTSKAVDISVPTKISDLTDDTATYPVDKADTLTGLTSTVSELNILDGVTASASEINILDGATLTTTELNYVDGVTSSIQTQLNAKLTPSDIVSSVSSSSTNSKAVGAKLFYDTCGDIETLINAL